jgi:hypothetical protein
MKDCSMLFGKNKSKRSAPRMLIVRCCSIAFAMLILLTPTEEAISDTSCRECVALGELSCRAGCDSHKSRAVILKCARDCAEERCEEICLAEQKLGQNTDSAATETSNDKQHPSNSEVETVETAD